MFRPVDCDLLLYADESCLVYQHRDVKENKQKQSKTFWNASYWFVSKKLSNQKRPKRIPFGTRKKLKQESRLSIRCGTIDIKNTTE